MTAPAAPTCPTCGNPDLGTHDLVNCVRYVAARLASLEAVVKQMGPRGEPAPAEKPCSQTSHPNRLPCVLPASHRGTHQWAAAPAVPTDAPARCSCNESLGLRETLRSVLAVCIRERSNHAQDLCDIAEMVEAALVYPAPESTPDVPGAQVACTQMKGIACDHPVCVKLRSAGQPIPPRTEAQGCSCVFSEYGGRVRDERGCPVHAVPPRPEGQGTVTVSHDMARAALFLPVRGDILARYINEREEYGGQVAIEHIALLRQKNEATSEAESLRAKLAALKAEATAERDGKLTLRAKYGARDNETWADFIARIAQPAPSREIPPGTGPAPTDGTAHNVNRNAACIESLCKVGDGYTEHDHKCDRLKRLLDAAEQRGRASRDGAVPAGAVDRWRMLPEFIREDTCRSLRESETATTGIKPRCIAARALEALASDAGKDGGR